MFINNYKKNNFKSINKKNILRFITAGSVDDGKSTLIGRLLYDSKKIFSDQLNLIYKSNKNINLSFITDGLEAEREQGITIDVAYRYFSTSKRNFIIADTPGHEQYTRNMITGASNSDAVIILIDISKLKIKKKINLLTQTKRHSTIISLLKIKHVIIAINKMDLINYDKLIYYKVIKAYKKFSKKINIKNIHFIPISALFGENIVFNTKKISWYKGPTLIKLLESLKINNKKKFLRFPIQLITKYNCKNKEIRGYMGRIISGKIKKNNKYLLLPYNKIVTIKKIYLSKKSYKNTYNLQSITILIKESIDISRGDLLVSNNHYLPKLVNKFKANICWLSEESLILNKKYLIKHNTKKTYIFIKKIYYLFNINNQKMFLKKTINLNDIAKILINTQEILIIDSYKFNKITGSFIIIDIFSNQTVAAGMII